MEKGLKNNTIKLLFTIYRYLYHVWKSRGLRPPCCRRSYGSIL